MTSFSIRLPTFESANISFFPSVFKGEELCFPAEDRLMIRLGRGWDHVGFQGHLKKSGLQGLI